MNGRVSELREYAAAMELIADTSASLCAKHALRGDVDQARAFAVDMLDYRSRARDARAGERDLIKSAAIV